jgi:hypothetical protein
MRTRLVHRLGDVTLRIQTQVVGGNPAAPADLVVGVE